MTASQLNAIGQGVALLGVLMLFRYGMPFRIRADGGEIVTTNPRPDVVRKDRIYDWLGWLGLFLIIGGTGAQIVANFWPPN
jgi:hypothetical protein